MIWIDIISDTDGTENVQICLQCLRYKKKINQTVMMRWQ